MLAKPGSYVVSRCAGSGWKRVADAPDASGSRDRRGRRQHQVEAAKDTSEV